MNVTIFCFPLWQTIPLFILICWFFQYKILPCCLQLHFWLNFIDRELCCYYATKLKWGVLFQEKNSFLLSSSIFVSNFIDRQPLGDYATKFQGVFLFLGFSFGTMFLCLFIIDRGKSIIYSTCIQQSTNWLSWFCDLQATKSQIWHSTNKWS